VNIYLASSWRNEQQPKVVEALRSAGFTVYDFKNPAPGNTGFHWSEIDSNWKQWNADQFVEALKHPVAIEGFGMDMSALKKADATVLLNPCGRSAHLELGYAVGAGQITVAICLSDFEVELMYKMVDRVCTTVAEAVAYLKYRQTGKVGIR